MSHQQHDGFAIKKHFPDKQIISVLREAESGDFRRSDHSYAGQYYAVSWLPSGYKN